MGPLKNKIPGKTRNRFGMSNLIFSIKAPLHKPNLSLKYTYFIKLKVWSEVI